MSVKVPPKGTRGVRFPRFLVRLGSRFTPGMFRRRPSRTSGGIRTLMLETRGARTGEMRNAILGYLEDGPDGWLIVGSLLGASRQPGWMYNLAKDPRGTVEFYGGERVEVAARTLHDAEREAAWRRVAVEAPEYTKYLEKTDREIPVVRLQRR